MKTNAQIFQEILAIAKDTLLNGSDMGYTMPDGKHHIYIYPDEESRWDDGPSDTFFVIEPNRVVNGAHEPMGDTYITTCRDLSEVLIGCQWCMDCFEQDLSKEVSLPDELIVRMAHEAGYMEAEGKIELHSWEDLQIAIHDAIREYYENPSERNPFSIEDTLDKILSERFPSEPEPEKSIYKELYILTCLEETKYGINIYNSLHPSSEEALRHVDEVQMREDIDPQNFISDFETCVIDVSRFQTPSREMIADYVLKNPLPSESKTSLNDMIQDADDKRNVKKSLGSSHRSMDEIIK